ncbi:PREDICTED: ankyrin repeat-containing protein NPR4-like [Tarenaya hassleriana]|uniref:ankyrin repeat-containing protein NPR4-like n=1 Tax=Tarenaya hassleriana TaxID=28532 RepID=UPI00053C09CF|nr:PREDICTED: ankyrin repeat-containing protein NPR4-like [Tarenaya hassleriana]
MDQRLRGAAQSGSIDELYALIHEDPHVLENVDDVPFVETPLHVAAACGETDFAMEMMNLKPGFARKLNTNGFSPLHLAVDCDQTRIALELVKVDPGLVRVRGREGMTPLHHVVRRGGADLVTEFLLACPECIRDVNTKSETALHIAVLNDRFEELQALTGWVQRMRQKDAASVEIQVLNRRDRDGNTALHLAAYHNKQQALNLLLKCPAVNRNIQNVSGLTPFDILQTKGHHTKRDLNNMARNFGCENSASLPKTKTASDFLRSPITFSDYYSTTMVRYRNSMSEGTRGALLVIAALIITVTYQTALQPPGGVHQDGGSKAGTVVMKEIYFILLWAFNSMAFWTALVLTFNLLPVGGEYTLSFFAISVPLFVSYAISIAVISNDSVLYLVRTLSMCLLGVPATLIHFFLKWKWSKLKKMPGPRSELIVEGFTTMGLARGVEQSKMHAWLVRVDLGFDPQAPKPNYGPSVRRAWWPGPADCGSWGLLGVGGGQFVSVCKGR